MPDLLEMLKEYKKEQEEKGDGLEEIEVEKTTPPPKRQKLPPRTPRRTVSPPKRLLDANKIHREIRKLDLEEYPAYSVMINRARSSRSSYVKDITALINMFIEKKTDIFK